MIQGLLQSRSSSTMNLYRAQQLRGKRAVFGENTKHFRNTKGRMEHERVNARCVKRPREYERVNARCVKRRKVHGASICRQSETCACHVTGIMRGTTMEQLKTCFEQVGEISRIEPFTEHRRTGKLKTRVFYVKRESVFRATRELHEYEINDKKLSVTVYTSRPEELRDLHVTGHPQEASKQQLYEYFSEIIPNVKVVRITKRDLFCFIQIYGTEDFQEALDKLHGAKLSNGDVISCQESKRKDDEDTQRKELARVMNDICKKNGITPLLSVNEMYLLEKSLRTVHLSQIPLDANKDKASYLRYFEQFGGVEDVTFLNTNPDYKFGYGFVIFADYFSRLKFREKGIDRAIIAEHEIKMQDSNSNMKCVKLAQAAGLFDSTRNPTQLIFQVLFTALQKVKTKASPARTIAMMDKTSGEVVHLTQEEYENYVIATQQMYSTAWMYGTFNAAAAYNNIQCDAQADSPKALNHDAAGVTLNNGQATYQGMQSVVYGTQSYSFAADMRWSPY